ncbi:EAL and HDOD domain-containing protein [Sporosarcina sp. YIM B06819]|uniref:EAL and HDOD domain-containing protein n=1 Tax=Sporosarcina sp. YIM B06819 TaxID=3081769 RepID=UPI00298C2DAF|nr:HDOD domain-containing protein [Sporosarcina sp. YIM B06819]
MKGIDIFVGRQPILDQQGDIFAYELLYRNSNDNFFPGVDSDIATIGLLVNTFLSIGVEKVAGKSVAFINFSGELLAQDIFSGLNPDRIIIEVLEDVEITPSLLTKMRLLKEAGFKIALDDFILQEQYLIHRVLFEIVDIVKVDYLHTTEDERIEIERFIKRYPNIQLLAEKIETEEQFLHAKTVGYQLFQGYFFAKPEIITGIEIPSNVSLHFQIIELFNKESPNIDEIASLIMRDMSLAYKLLRFINTMAFQVPKRISSIKQAIVVIGLQETKKWMLIIALHEMGEGQGKGRIKALVNFSLTRAKMCELLAKHADKKNPDEYFLAGMFSFLNVIMKRDWDDILEQIPLSDVVARTLKGEQTEITLSLELSKAIEQLDWKQFEQLAEEIGITNSKLSAYSLEAYRWAQIAE